MVDTVGNANANARGKRNGRVHMGTRREHKTRGTHAMQEHTGSIIDDSGNDAPPRECNQTRSELRGKLDTDCWVVRRRVGRIYMPLTTSISSVLYENKVKSGIISKW